MKESNFMLTLLIPGPKSPGKDIDVYLRPLIEDLQVLWDKKGVETTDIVSGQNFNMRAMVLWTINDFPARSSLSGWSGQGYKACPTCNEETPSIGVKNKIAYVGHRRFLRKPHKWRSSREFNGDTDHRDPPKEYPRDVILAQHARLLTRVPGKHPKHGGVKIKRNVEVELNWTKRSIFYELEYWSFILLRHNLDIMHIEKNVLEAILNTLLMNDKSKDTAKARQDLQKLGIRRPLWLTQNQKGKWLKPQAAYSFTPEDRKKFCQYIKGVKLPDGFGSCFKHKQLFSATLMEDDMLKASVKVVDILCELELIYPPAFFDIMIHLPVHLALEALEGGPIHPGYFTKVWIDTYRAQFQSLFPEKNMLEEFTGWFRTLICERHANNLQDPESRDERRTTQNSGICAPGPDGEMSYGQLQEILEFKYLSFKVALFRVKWFDTRNNGRVKKLTFRNGMTQIIGSAWLIVARAWRGGGGEGSFTSTSYIIRLRGLLHQPRKRKAKAQFGRRESRQEDPGKESKQSTYNLEPHMRSERWPRIEGYIQAQFGKSYNTNKATLKREHWIRDPETGAYDLDRIRRGKPDEYTDDEWEKYINFWNDPANAQRAETNRLNRSKSTVVSRHGSRSIPLTRHLMKMTSATQEEPSEIDTFYRLHTVNGVFQDPEALRMYDRMRELEATGEHTTAEINAMVRGGKLRGHIPGVGPVMPGYVRSRLSYTAPVDRSRDVDFMMNLMRSNNRFADAFARYDSGGASGSGGSRARDREDGDDTGGEDGGDDTS
ncbi:zinc finger, PHD-type containing protein [Tanacetum coccineum]